MWKTYLLAVVTFFAAVAATMSVSMLKTGGSEISTKCIGFLGCGKISSAVARGYAGENLKSLECL
jgi:phosphoglycerate dehydrogenase-like enzyme